MKSLTSATVSVSDDAAGGRVFRGAGRAQGRGRLGDGVPVAGARREEGAAQGLNKQRNSNLNELIEVMIMNR